MRTRYGIGRCASGSAAGSRSGRDGWIEGIWTSTWTRRRASSPPLARLSPDRGWPTSESPLPRTDRVRDGAARLSRLARVRAKLRRSRKPPGVCSSEMIHRRPSTQPRFDLRPRGRLPKAPSETEASPTKAAVAPRISCCGGTEEPRIELSLPEAPGRMRSRARVLVWACVFEGKRHDATSRSTRTAMRGPQRVQAQLLARGGTDGLEGVRSSGSRRARRRVP